LSYRHRTVLLALAAGLPATALAVALIWSHNDTAKVQWTATAAVVAYLLIVVSSLRRHVLAPLQSISNLLGALREGDFTQRGHRADERDELGLVLWEINQLANVIQEQRLGAIEASILLRQVMAEIDVAVFAFDSDDRLLLLNRAGERLLAKPARQLVGTPAAELGMLDCLTGKVPRTIDGEFPGGAGRWELSRNPIRRGGRRHQLVVLSNVQRALREQERQAWKRLIRVLSHEINNSLAPISSLADSLSEGTEPDDLRRGLAIIRGRAAALGRFMDAYARLARLPPPNLSQIDVAVWVQRVAELDSRAPVTVLPGPAVTVSGDGDQLDQLLINLVQNAIDAAIETRSGVEVGWRTGAGRLEVFVRDEGPGLPSTANLFVPFFTTKKHGTGIGLALSQQIAEAHDGSLSLQNRTDRRGCIARLLLPLPPALAGQ
jgi:two-component system, NtrC family, nitrogen regulation sensor histidine kinase NtrY